MKKIIALCLLMVIGCGEVETWRTRWVRENGTEVEIVETLNVADNFILYTAKSTTTNKLVIVCQDTMKPLKKGFIYELKPTERWATNGTAIRIKD